MLVASDIDLLKRSIDQSVEIETKEGERLTAKVLLVTNSEEYDERELLYELISTNMLESYKHRETTGGYVTDFNEIISLKRLEPSS